MYKDCTVKKCPQLPKKKGRFEISSATFKTYFKLSSQDLIKSFAFRLVVES